MKLGFIVNPIAGMGGRVGLKGTNGVLKEAIARGAEPVAPERAIEFLRKLRENMENRQIEILTCPGIMGENEAEKAKFPVQVLPMRIGKETTAEDTKAAVKLLIKAEVDLIVFVGGDGTAKDILDAMQGSNEVPVLGVPSGVKMYSGVFAVNPRDAVEVVLIFADKQAEITEFEIMDSDEKAIRSDIFAVKLHGYLKGPFVPMRIQGSKQASPETNDEKENQTAIARFIIEEMQPDATYILGPGTTVKRIAELLGTVKTVLGVDIYKNGKVMLDVDEKRILKEVKDWQNTWIILSPIGHQGILLGRGNQQISPEIIKHVRKEHIIVVATKGKLQSIEGNVLRVDTGDTETDNMLKGHIKVVTDYREWRLMPVQ
ncbi:MAG: ATP-NAD kinase family protein [Candidatus Bathyarchaeota archaeon]|jgi:predicted polyphosphate/ATP-dependent NAD kinase|nr:ATP-NAD kinase family protein [Candidatus Bathyarchaeota archaeon A05DMB-5]MDH7557129.1 ATP-NAD kinase family protein [Candidatus Bathyarchaeota archaeon]